MFDVGLSKRKIKERIEPLVYRFGVSMQGSTPYVDLVDTMSLFEPTRETSLIRLGGDGDGGYWVPESIAEIDALLSPGVNGLWNFEMDLKNQFGVQAYLCDRADATEGSPFPAIDKYVGSHTNGKFISMDKWVEDLGLSDSRDLGLQMDIEGAEYPTILGMSETLMGNLKIMVVEFHWLDQITNTRVNSLLVKPTIAKILNTHEVVHAQVNPLVRYSKIRNLILPMALEVTFARRA